ncbi:MAG TPA: hypothetical protein VIN01_06730 [Candidatus Dormibacteraeota bacterium]|jgi:hypothetical protein
MAADQALYLAKRSGRDCSASAGQLAQSFIDDPKSLLGAIGDAGPQIVVSPATTSTVTAAERRTD